MAPTKCRPFTRRHWIPSERATCWQHTVIGLVQAWVLALSADAAKYNGLTRFVAPHNAQDTVAINAIAGF